MKSLQFPEFRFNSHNYNWVLGYFKENQMSFNSEIFLKVLEISQISLFNCILTKKRSIVYFYIEQLKSLIAFFEQKTIVPTIRVPALSLWGDQSVKPNVGVKITTFSM